MGGFWGRSIRRYWGPRPPYLVIGPSTTLPRFPSPGSLPRTCFTFPQQVQIRPASLLAKQLPPSFILGCVHEGNGTETFRNFSASYFASLVSWPARFLYPPLASLATEPRKLIQQSMPNGLVMLPRALQGQFLDVTAMEALRAKSFYSKGASKDLQHSAAGQMLQSAGN